MDLLNSRTTRVQPIFGWLRANGGKSWPAQLLGLADGISGLNNCGSIKKIELESERSVLATPARLAWMITNADKLTPRDGSQWKKLRQRVADLDKVEKALAELGQGRRTIQQSLVLEGPTHCDCLIECEYAFIWIEGKRFDWLEPSTTWDVSRDQLARNVEAVWWLASAAAKDYCVLICHEHALKHHETQLLDGYRGGTWSAGWPHISVDQRREFSTRIGTITWSKIAEQWSDLHELTELHDLGWGLNFNATSGRAIERQFGSAL